MPDRVVSYVFRGSFGNLTAGLAASGRATADLGTKLTALDAKGTKARRGLTTLGSTAGKAGLVAAVGLGVMVAAAANFDQAMSNVAATGSEARDRLDELRQAALDAGAATKFSATEAAAGVENLLKAGVSAEDVLSGGLSGALDLAAAGGLEVAAAAEIAATALTQFKLSGEDVPHVADLLAAGAGKAQGDVSDLSMALKQSGLVASQMGVSIEETTGTLAAFASAGLLGSDAGTSFRTMLLRLANPTKESATLMSELGINAYDAQGNFVGMASVAEQLQVAFEGKTQAERDSALATIFGSDAIRAASVLYTQGGEGVAQWTANVNDSGYAAETAAIKMDNLKGDLEELKGSLETALIGGGEGSQGALRSMTQGLTTFVNALADMPGPAKSATTSLLALTAVTGGGLWFGTKVISGIANTKEMLDQLGASAGKARTALSALKGSLALAGAVVVLGAVDALLDSIANHDFSDADLGRNLEALATGRIVGNLDDIGTKLAVIENKGASGMDRAFGWVPGVSSTTEEAATNIDKIDQALAGMVEGGNAEQAAAVFAQVQAQADKAGVSADTLGSSFTAYQTALDNAAAATAPADAALTALLNGPMAGLPGVALDAAGATGELAGATEASAAANREEAKAINEATQAMRDKRDAALAAFDAETGWGQAVAAAAEAVDKGKRGISRFTEAGRENRGVLSDLAGAWNNQSAAVQNTKGRFEAARKTFVDTAVAMGVPKKAAEALARELLNIPRSKVVKVEAPGAKEAAADVSALGRNIANLKSKKVYIDVIRTGPGGTGGADGMTVPGRRYPYGDRFPALLAPGEEVISNRHGQADRFRADRAAGRIPRYAGGGTAGGGYDPAMRPWDMAGAAAGAIGGLKGLQAQLKASETSLEKERTQRDAVADKMTQLSDSVSSGLRSDIFAPQDNVWASGGASGEAMLDADIARGREFTRLVKQLKSKGLGGAALADLLSRADVDLARLYASMSADDLKRIGRKYDVREAVLGATGQASAQAVFGSQLARQEKQFRDELKELREIKQAIKTADKNGKKNSDDNAAQVTKGINKGARDGRRRSLA